MKKIILGSGSPRRKEILTNLIGNNYEIIKSKFEEDNNANLPPLELAKVHSIGKAREVAQRVDEGIVIGSDTFIYFKGEVLGKPGSYENAKRMLEALSGNEVEVYSGIALVDAEDMKEIVDVCVTKIKFRKLEESLIEGYLEREKPWDNAGALKIQTSGCVLVESMSGDYNAVVGMPGYHLDKLFREFGINIFDYD